MKKNKLQLFIATFLIVAAVSCNKDLPSGEIFDAYSWSGVDDDGGSWKQVHMSSPSFYPVAAPLASTDPALASELAALKEATTNVTAEQRSAVEYWGGNSVLRWNEIARQLMSKYNLLPAPNEDGSYNFPSALTPDQYPYFPFASPPYASRGYAYLSIATFDALIAAWNYKYTYNRPAPYKIDPSITTLLPDNNIPSYPSEDAVVARVSLKILSALFPNEKEFLMEKASECISARQWAGMNLESDLVAGQILGDSIAANFLRRAKTDRMGLVNGKQSQWDSLQAYTEARGEIPYRSLEIPPRPPLGFFFGNVKTWVVNADAELPPPPVSTSSEEFKKQCDTVKSYTKHPAKSDIELANYWADGPGGYAPPGHWNVFATRECIERKLNPLRTARVLAYMNMAIQDAGICCWHSKYTYFVCRPADADPEIHPTLFTPPFPAYTSGHSAFSAAAATVLSSLFPDKASWFNQQATEASLSRVVSGIHFPMDTRVGFNMGESVGTQVAAKAAVDGAE